MQLREEAAAKAAAVPDSERPVKPPSDDSISLAEFHNYVWRMDVKDVPVEHFERSDFFSSVRKALKTFDTVYVVDTVRREWHVHLHVQSHFQPRSADRGAIDSQTHIGAGEEGAVPDPNLVEGNVDGIVCSG